MPDTRTVVITGSTRGIGRGLAEDLLRLGCRVVVSGRAKDVVDRVVAELRDVYGTRVAGFACDVADLEQVRALYNGAVTEFGRVDIWINNAGISHRRAPLHEQDEATIDEVVGTNVIGTLNGCRVAIAGMKATGGWVWNMEGFGSNGMTAPGIAIYGATKRAITYLTKALVKETKRTPVKVGWLSPGIVVTDLLAKDYEGDRAAWEKARKVFNILGDEVSTVTPFLAKRILSADRSGERIAWLTRSKAAARFATARFRKRSLPLPEVL